MDSNTHVTIAALNRMQPGEAFSFLSNLATGVIARTRDGYSIEVWGYGTSMSPTFPVGEEGKLIWFLSTWGVV